MNERNVEALADLLRAYLDDVEGHGAMDNVVLARCLADRGVLVPSALTDSQLADIWWDGSDGRDFMRPGEMREGIERIAKGETA